MEKTLWEKAVEFHGHSCMGLATGFRVGQAAMRALGSSRDVDEELVAIVENDSCAVDAIQVITGCTLGKGNLIFKDHGKQAYTFALRPSGKAVRISVKKRDDHRQAQLAELRDKIFSGEATAEEKVRYDSLRQEMIDDFLSRPLEEVLAIREIDVNLPEKARIFASVECAFCGERVMEPRARVKDGRIACIPCADQYTRGWGS